MKRPAVEQVPEAGVFERVADRSFLDELPRLAPGLFGCLFVQLPKRGASGLGAFGVAPGCLGGVVEREHRERPVTLAFDEHTAVERAVDSRAGVVDVEHIALADRAPDLAPGRGLAGLVEQRRGGVAVDPRLLPPALGHCRSPPGTAASTSGSVASASSACGVECGPYPQM